MTFDKKKHVFYVLLRVLFLFLTLLALSYFLLKKHWGFALFVLPFLVWAVSYFIHYTNRINREVAEFLEALHYRDFTRQYAIQKSPMALQPLRQGFNKINKTFKHISREKEIQYQYLQQMLELMDTGILSFEIDSGKTMWMNEALKQLLDIPYLKNIQRLEKHHQVLLVLLKELKTGESRVITLKKNDSSIKALLNVSVFQTDGSIYKLVAFHNVSEALDETEAMAWQKLLSVMTHEIMNSVAPIASLADTLKKRLQQKGDNLYEDLKLGMDTIKRRSEGLTKFADTYRNLSRISRLNKTDILVRDLFENIYLLMEPTLQQKNIELEIVLQETDIRMEADQSLMEQVLINLILNAVEAVKDQLKPVITLSAGYENNKPFIAVTDNGSGITEELSDKIFIPFFSTRKNGNGIGLSLCKQIMILHGGVIRVHTREGEGTSFQLILN